jgi:tRNA(Ile)-lysidine synthase
MLKAFQQYIQSKSLFKRSDKILLAISGGIDSMVMLDLFQKSGYSFEVAHCNFMLRGEDSYADEAFVLDYCKSNGILCHTIRFDTTAISKEKKYSIEETARDLRYTWFNELIVKHNLTYIATAHHKNDVSETLIHNFARGTGIAGLHGILPKSHHVIRPLLFASKNELEAYAHIHQIKFVYDHTNSQTIYTRNKIRHELIPILNSLNPEFINNSNRLADVMKEVEDLLSFFLADIRNKILSTRGKYICLDLSVLDGKILNQTLIFELIKAYGFNSSQSSDIFELIGKSGKVFHSKEFDLFIDRMQLFIRSNANLEIDKTNITIDELPYEIEIHGVRYSFELLDKNNIANEDLKEKKISISTSTHSNYH